MLSNHDGVVCVLHLLETVQWLSAADALPINNTGVHLVKRLQEDNTILKIGIQVVDEWINIQTVQPKSKD
jgi:hypothetical protein